MIQERGAPVTIGRRQGGLRTDVGTQRRPQSRERNEIYRLFTLPAGMALDADPLRVRQQGRRVHRVTAARHVADSPEIQDELYAYNAEWWADNRGNSAREMGELAAAVNAIKRRP